MSQSRRIFLLLCALFALSGSMVTLIGTQAQQREQLRGYVDATRNAALPFRIPRLGVNAELTQYSADELNTQLDLMQQAGVHWVRQFAHWDQIQPEIDTWSWIAWDRISEAFASRDDLQLVVVLHHTPDWANGEHSIPTAPPADPIAFGEFAQAFAERYGEVVDVYQIWDEPNLSIGWGNHDPQPAEYVALLSAAYSAIKSADSGATVISAALAPTIETGPKNISDWQYLDTLYQLGAAEVMDAVAGKPYGFSAVPNDRTVQHEVLNFSRIVGLREVMQKYDDDRTALWGSGWGWNTLPDNWTGAASIWGSVTAEQQRDYTQTALQRAEREWTWLGGLILYHWQPDALPDDPIWGFALIGQGNTPTPLYQSLLSRALETDTTVATNGLYPAANASAHYSGVWTFSELGADIGWLKDSRFTFDFVGRDIALLLREGDYVGYLYPQIDNQAQSSNALERDAAGNPYIILSSNTLNPEVNVVLVARNLIYEQHTPSAVADEGYDQYALVGYAVSDGDLAEPFHRQLSLAALTTLMSGVAVIVIAVRIHWRAVLRPLIQVWSPLSDIVQIGLTAIASVLLLMGMLLTFGREEPALLRREPVQLALAILTAGLLYLNLSLPIAIISVLILLFIFYHRPPLGLLTVIIFAPFFLFPVELYRFAFPMSELLILILTTAWGLRAAIDWANRRHGNGVQRSSAVTWPRWNGLDVVMGLWLLLGLIAILWSSQRALAFTDFRTLFLEPALFYLIFRTTIHQVSDLQRLFDGLLVAGLLVAVIGLFLFARGEAVITAEGAVRRLASVYGSPNNVALFLGRCIPFALSFMLVFTQRWRQISAGVVLSLLLIAALLTQSVGGIFIGIPASVAVVLLLRYRQRAALPLVILFVVAASALVIGAAISPRIARVFTFTEGTNFIRLRLWQSSLNMLQDHPLTGLGLDQFLYAYRGQYILPDAKIEPNLSHPHNIVLDYWLRLGFAGILLLAATQVFFWRLLLRRVLPTARQEFTKDRRRLAISIGLAGSMVNLLSHGLIDNSVYVIDLALVFVLLCASVACLTHRSPEQN